jgi:hypothetical protein
MRRWTEPSEPGPANYDQYLVGSIHASALPFLFSKSGWFVRVFRQPMQTACSATATARRQFSIG